ncbi:flagellar motor stator protein MotA [Curvivirga aplysinae]|uniref:flagellar motor stator protein MotA n=1 Tax=Curvivirga aplysinae TaxID=2529852 RepID=UPI0012BCBD74|nr:flagellar motor stator protein MotA [Curvivirga aplysinae]MTI09656.1 flagellar motor stator protein MotA [Curvivirga aplysinae]
MFVLIGMIAVVACVIGSYVAMGGKLAVLNQPFEVVIIFGSGISAFIISNPMKIVKAGFGRLGKTFKGPKYKAADYLELLLCQYQVFKLMKQKGALALEPHVENPHDSALFKEFPTLSHDHHALEFFCDYLRLMTLGTDNPHELETLMDLELEVHHHEDHSVGHALTNLAESFPALGIVAAVLGVIKTMGSISEPPEVLGGLIAGALVGTFLGILLCYGWFAPLASNAKQMMEEEATYMNCLKMGMLAHLQGYAPQVSVEFARKALASHMRPSFAEVEEATGTLPPVA